MQGVKSAWRQPLAFLFDAYGTLFDVSSVAQSLLAGLPCEPKIFAQLWRQKQLEYTWLRALMDRYEDFLRVTEAALLAAARQLSVPLTDEQARQLMEAYSVMPAFGDVKPALEALRAFPLAILSNGTPAMLDAALRNTHLEAYFSAVISVDPLGIYKPSPRVYALGPEALKLPASQICFVSSNWWDAAGAKAFGYNVCWCNRGGAMPENLGFTPDITVGSLAELMGAVTGALQPAPAPHR